MGHGVCLIAMRVVVIVAKVVKKKNPIRTLLKEAIIPLMDIMDDFEEDEIQPWLVKQLQDAQEAQWRYNSNEKIGYKEGDQVGNFLFVKQMAYKNRAVFACPECGRKFQYNIYAIKNKKRCKWYKEHKKSS